MIGRLTFDRAEAIRGTFTRRHALRGWHQESPSGFAYSSTWYSNQNGVQGLTRLTKEEEFYFRFEEIAINRTPSTCVIARKGRIN